MSTDVGIKNISTLNLQEPIRSIVEEGQKVKVSDVPSEDKRAGASNLTDKINEIVETINKKIESLASRGIHLEVEKELKIIVAKVVERDSGEVIRQIPPAELIEIKKRLRGHNSGLILNKGV